jgi:hypothetical protein
MKQRILVTALASSMLFLSACSSTQPTKIADVSRGDLVQPGTSSGQAIAEQRLAISDFKSKGIKLFYDTNGRIEAIEVTGYAAVWGNSMNSAREAYRVAELEAKKSLNDFINKETIASSVSVRMISQNLEKASDQNTNRFASNKTPSNDLIALDTEVTADKGESTNQAENTAVRNNALRVASVLNTTITTNNRGILGGLYLKQGRTVDDGRGVEVTMRWDRRHNQARQQIRNLMAQ